MEIKCSTFQMFPTMTFNIKITRSVTVPNENVSASMTLHFKSESVSLKKKIHPQGQKILDTLRSARLEDTAGHKKPLPHKRGSQKPKRRIFRVQASGWVPHNPQWHLAWEPRSALQCFLICKYTHVWCIEAPEGCHSQRHIVIINLNCQPKRIKKCPGER